MGKEARNRQRRARSTDQGNTECRDPAHWEHWLSEGPLPGDDPHTLALLARLATEHHMWCKLTYLHDPVLGRGAVPVAGIREDGTLIPDRSGTVDPIPVVMFEPSRSVISQDSRTGTAHDLLTEALITAGFHRIAPGPIWSGRSAAGWGIYRRTDGLVLRDPDGAVYAEGRTALDPAWVSIATSLGSVLVLHGPCLGIRIPAGRTTTSYTIAERAEEITRGRQYGLLAGATVRWHPEPLEETLTWVLLPPGVYFQPLPIVYVPRWEFNRHSGPETFGLAPFRSFGEIPRAQGMVAHITETDVDFYRPNVDRDLSFICGYHALGGTADSRYAAWQQTALTARRLLLITGSREMPTGTTVQASGPEGFYEAAWNVLCESSVAIVTTTADSPAPLKT